MRHECQRMSARMGPGYIIQTPKKKKKWQSVTADASDALKCLWYSVKSWRPTEDVFMSPDACKYFMALRLLFFFGPFSGGKNKSTKQKYDEDCSLLLLFVLYIYTYAYLHFCILLLSVLQDFSLTDRLFLHMSSSTLLDIRSTGGSAGRQPVQLHTLWSRQSLSSRL